MDQGHQIRLTAGEVTQLWAQYMNDSGSVCMLTYFAEKAEDEDIKPLIEYALKISQNHIEKLTSIFKEEKFAIPYGFKVEEDVNLQAPRLYSDSYALTFVHQMAMIGLTNYAAAVSASVREDISDYYMECLSETMELFKKAKQVLLQKGLMIRAPYIPNLAEIEFVKKQSFVWDIFGNKRPLIAAEISNLFSNLQRNALGAATLTGFAQVAQSKEVTDFFIKGIEIAKKHVRIFSTKLEESNLPSPTTWSSEVTDSTAKTFSDKLMLFFTSGMISLSVGYYGTAVAQSPRVDIGIMYNRLSAEVQLYSEDGANLMIKNGWLEQPPMAPDRDELARKKKK
ncbi:DUF3231 family protein [Mesobacillus maritimus]|uniref:DUF3231 family protein n=1 Tax=Mesobacillus maritimus TaxID=1643336 RepID=UPI00203F0A72|nr:DUF3231 family protein [Mesobacillus maritimus]MCM3586929.1 DUF3231 family protein [Mesobacillus maritimus]